MKKIVLLAALAVVASAAPILAQDRERQDRFEDRVESFEDRLEDNGFVSDQYGFSNGTYSDRDRFDEDGFDEDGFVDVAGISQQFEQEKEEAK